MIGTIIFLLIRKVIIRYIFVAAEYGRSNPVVNVLINAKADLNVQDNNGLTALMIGNSVFNFQQK